MQISEESTVKALKNYEDRRVVYIKVRADVF
jgi:hypothetical protein